MSLVGQGTDITGSPVLAMKYILPWFEAMGKAVKFGRRVMRGLATEGTYEVLDYGIRLELMDSGGKRARVYKQEKVKYLQNNIIAFQDQAWGDGKILQNYKCTPGVPVDKYRLGYKTHVLISLREVKNRGDVDEFNIQWGISKGFLSPTGFWGTDVDHKTDKVGVQIVFPKYRPPLRTSMLEKNTQRVSAINNDRLTRLPDGRWVLAWEQPKPRRHEQYLLCWEW